MYSAHNIRTIVWMLSKINRYVVFLASRPHSLTELKRMSECMQKSGNSDGCNFEKFGDTWRKAKPKFFRHILRCSRADPLSQVTFAADGIRPRHVVSRRPGRPKLDWVIESYRDAFRFLNGQGAQFDPANINHLRQVKEHAILREF